MKNESYERLKWLSDGPPLYVNWIVVPAGTFEIRFFANEDYSEVPLTFPQQGLQSPATEHEKNLLCHLGLILVNSTDVLARTEMKSNRDDDSEDRDSQCCKNDAERPKGRFSFLRSLFK